MINSILNNWNFVRVLRFVLGIIIIFEGIYLKHAMFIIAGVIFTSMALFNKGCCSTNGCYTNAKSSIPSKKEINYEEVI